MTSWTIANGFTKGEISKYFTIHISLFSDHMCTSGKYITDVDIMKFKYVILDKYQGRQWRGDRGAIAPLPSPSFRKLLLTPLNMMKVFENLLQNIEH